MRFSEVQYDTIKCGGGLDLITPTLKLDSGVARDCLNFECYSTGGYNRIAGYERLDGRPKPSSAGYTVLNVTGSTSPTVGSTITGNSSGATGVLCAIETAQFIITKASGTYTNGEILKVGAVTVGTFTVYGSPSTIKKSAVYQVAASDIYRADILAPVGSGPARGAFLYNDVVYAFRDNAGATACNLWRATVAGWVQVTYPFEISFTAGGGATLPVDGATLTQGGMTATVRRIMTANTNFGSNWTGTAAGRLILTNIAGGNFAAGAATLSGGATLTLSGIQTQIVQLPGGRYVFDQGNFTGRTATQRVYGCDNVNRAFEFDGTTFCPITTGTSPDTPKYVAVHKNQLFWAILSSLVGSAPSLPFNYTAASNASEILCGSNITGMQVQPGTQTTGTMAIYTANNTQMLYGVGLANWNLVIYNTGTGAIDYTTENFAFSYQFDPRGIATLSATLNFGNFDQTTLTANIKPFIDANRTKAVGAVLCRDKNQYRAFFSSGYALYLTQVNDKYLGAMPVYFPISGSGASGMNNVWEGAYANGDEILLGSGSDGMIYQMEKGTSFDGAAIPAYVTLNYNPTQSPRILKRYRKCALEVQGKTYNEITFNYSLGYGGSEVPQPIVSTYPNNFNPSFWDSMTWDMFTWDGTTLLPSELEMNGTAENVAVTFGSNNNYSGEFVLNTAILHYTLRRGLR